MGTEGIDNDGDGLINDDVPVSGNDLFPFLSNVIINSPVSHRIIPHVLGSGPSENHPACVVEILASHDVGMGEKEVPSGFCLGISEGIRAGTILDIMRLPVEPVIAVHVIATQVIFVNEAVAVVVDALGSQQRVFPFLSGSHRN
ncbi:hypothetical protein ES703_98505 [subsurface metagenome]